MSQPADKKRLEGQKKIDRKMMVVSASVTQKRVPQNRKLGEDMLKNKGESMVTKKERSARCSDPPQFVANKQKISGLALVASAALKHEGMKKHNGTEKGLIQEEVNPRYQAAVKKKLEGENKIEKKMVACSNVTKRNLGENLKKKGESNITQKKPPVLPRYLESKQFIAAKQKRSVLTLAAPEVLKHEGTLKNKGMKTGSIKGNVNQKNRAPIEKKQEREKNVEKKMVRISNATKMTTLEKRKTGENLNNKGDPRVIESKERPLILRHSHSELSTQVVPEAEQKNYSIDAIAPMSMRPEGTLAISVKKRILEMERLKLIPQAASVMNADRNTSVSSIPTKKTLEVPGGKQTRNGHVFVAQEPTRLHERLKSDGKRSTKNVAVAVAPKPEPNNVSKKSHETRTRTDRLIIQKQSTAKPDALNQREVKTSLKMATKDQEEKKRLKMLKSVEETMDALKEWKKNKAKVINEKKPKVQKASAGTAIFSNHNKDLETRNKKELLKHGNKISLERRKENPELNVCADNKRVVEFNPNGEVKLVLVLDLDNTLLHSAELEYLSPNETQLLNHSSPDLIQWNPEEPIVTKLRPFVHPFLKEASSMFELFIYTKASDSYARSMAKILDPENIYFCDNKKIISGETEPQPHGKKNLWLVERDRKHIVVVDDREDVWREHRDNLVQIETYNYFPVPGATKSILQSGEDEEENTGALVGVLDVLRRVHTTFFHDPDQASIPMQYRDVRAVLLEISEQQTMLKGCKLPRS